MTLSPELQETVDYIGICRLQDAYADVVTRQAWDEFPGLFTDDCRIDLDLRDDNTMSFATAVGLAEFIANSLQQFEFFQFVVLNRIVRTDTPTTEAATGRMYMCELRQFHATGRRSDAFGVYDDRYARVGGRWLFAHRQYHSVARTSADLDVFSIPEPPA